MRYKFLKANFSDVTSGDAGKGMVDRCRKSRPTRTKAHCRKWQQRL